MTAAWVTSSEWAPVEGERGRLVSPGHQFEWARMLERWARLSDNMIARAAAIKLYEVGLAGVDP